MEFGTSAGALESAEADDLSVGALNRTSLTMSAGDLNTIGGSEDRGVLVNELLRLGGL